MSGIFALYAPTSDESTRKRRTAELTRALKHRGPDYQGEWYDDVVPLSLGHRRLAIMDLSPDGRQPMVSASGRYIISFNGEIYNFQDLRDTLTDLGAHFRSRSDTEVILTAIDMWGLNTACQKINGMFAIIVWDRHTKEMHLIRDRLGEKPLYIGWAGSDLIVASELKSFTAHPDFVRNVSDAATAHYFQLGFVPAPHTIFRDVYMLTPGSRMVLRPTSLSPGQDLRPFMTPYWSPARVVEDVRLSRPQMAAMSFDARRDVTEKLIQTCVRERMITDVPFGTFLSGDIQSSLITAMAQKNADRPVKTYTVGWSNNGHDAMAHARNIAHHLGTDHHEHIMTPDDVARVIPDLPKIADEPLADTSLIPSYLLAHFARSDVTVALHARGSEAFFGGYDRHTKTDRLIKTMHWLPMPLRNVLQHIIRTLGPTTARLFHPHDPLAVTRIHTLAAFLTRDDLPHMYEFLAGLGEENAITMLPRALTGYPFRQSTSWPTGLDVPEWMMFADTLHDMPNNILTGLDRTSMAVSLEARAPLCDMRLFAHAWTLPLTDKIHRGHGNVMLRHILSRYLPRELMPTSKRQPAVPMHEWLSGPLKPWAQDVLAMPFLYDTFGLDSTSVRHVWDNHMNGTSLAPHTLWRLLTLNAWGDQWLTH